jgi:hypothetical protein
MFKAIPPAHVVEPQELPTPALDNPAIARCVHAWTTVRQRALASRKSEGIAMLDGAAAYCAAIPPLTGAQNIADFVACVGHGLAIGIIHESKFTALMSAAKVALATVPKEARKQPPSSQNHEKIPSEPVSI